MTSTASSGRSRPALIVVGLAMVALGVVAVLALLGGTTRQESTEEFEAVSRLEFDLENARIEIVAGERVRVERSLSTGIFGGRTSNDLEGDVLRVVQSCPPFFSFGCGGSFVVTLPPDTAVEGETSNGAIRVAGLGGDVAVATSNGPVTLEGLGGRLDVETSNGPVTGIDLLSEFVEVGTSNGRIELVFGSAPSSVVANSSNGGIEVAVPADSPAYAVDASTSNGQTDIGIRTDPASPNSISLSTSNAGITVRLTD